METHDLIRTLSRDAYAPGPSMLRTLVMCTGAALVYCVVAILVTRGLRPDFGAAAPWVAVKAGVSLLFVVCAFPLALRLSRPERPAGVWGAASVVAFGLAVATAAAATVIAAPQYRVEALTGGDFPHCVVIIPTLAIPAAAIFFIWFRRYAPTRLALAGAAAGGLSGALSAMAYALTCPVDSLAFVTTWYPLAIAICAGAGAPIGMRALKW